MLISSSSLDANLLARMMASGHPSRTVGLPGESGRLRILAAGTDFFEEAGYA
jgi:hypothetical protein